MWKVKNGCQSQGLTTNGNKAPAQESCASWEQGSVNRYTTVLTCLMHNGVPPRAGFTNHYYAELILPYTSCRFGPASAQAAGSSRAAPHYNRNTELTMCLACRSERQSGVPSKPSFAKAHHGCSANHELQGWWNSEIMGRVPGTA